MFRIGLAQKTFSFPAAAVLAVCACIAIGSCGEKGTDSESDGSEAAFRLPASPENYKPLEGYGEMKVPSDNPMTLAKAKLGRQLFFDKRLSGDGSRSCYSCHLNEKGLSDGLDTAVGAFEKKLTRNSPTLWNIGFHQAFYWNGRAPSLEKQAAAAWKGGNMGAKANFADIVATINSIDGYKSQFQEVFGGEATDVNIPEALSCYMRTIIGGNTAWDRYLAGDEGAVSEAAIRGHEVFKKAKCDTCHSGKLFTDLQFHNVGIEYTAPGHGKVNTNPMFKGAFKTPTLRDVVDSGPYFHDGSVDNLELAVRFMLMGGVGGEKNPTLDKALKRYNATDEEFKDLMEFLKALDEEGTLSEPELP